MQKGLHLSAVLSQQAFAWRWESSWWQATTRLALTFLSLCPESKHGVAHLQYRRPVWLVPFGIVFEGVSLAWFYLIQKDSLH